MDTETMSRLVAAAPADVQSHLLAMPDAQRMQVLQEAAHHFSSTPTSNAPKADPTMQSDAIIARLCKDNKRFLKGKEAATYLAATLQQNLVCTACGAKPSTLGALKRCGSCKATQYCSVDCQKRDWSSGTIDRKTKLPLPPHKTTCSTFAKYMQRCAVIGDTLSETFAFDASLVVDRLHLGHWHLLAGRDLLGNKDKGYWSLQEASSLVLPEKEGWHTLSPREWPNLECSSSKKRQFLPKHAADATKWTNWQAYLDWRILPPTSPAALLLHSPLTVFQALCCAGMVGEHQKEITLHLIDVNGFLPSLPIFRELALLLPGQHVHLHVFGALVHKHVMAHGSPTELTYEAPADLGAGQISIHLQGEAAHWQPPSADAPIPPPDLIVALQANVGETLPQWQKVIFYSFMQRVPFCFTEEREDRAVDAQQKIQMMLKAAAEHATTATPAIRATVDQMARDGSTVFPVHFNPFHRPGASLYATSDLDAQKKSITHRFPVVQNGFLCQVTLSQ